MYSTPKHCTHVYDSVYLNYVYLNHVYSYSVYLNHVKLQVSFAKETYKRDYIMQKETYNFKDSYSVYLNHVYYDSVYCIGISTLKS